MPGYVLGNFFSFSVINVFIPEWGEYLDTRYSDEFWILRGAGYK